jgi:hypothetical protein
MKSLARLYPFVIAIGVLIWVLGLPLVGATVFLAGLILWLGVGIEASRSYVEGKNQSYTSTSKPNDDDESAHLNMGNGNVDDRINVHRSKLIYERTVFFGDPPIKREVWEYLIKDDRAVFHRLRDRSEESFGPPEYEVVNNVVLEGVYKEKQREWDESKSRWDTKRLEYWENRPLYSDEQLAALRQETLWDEVHGILKYFILYCHSPYGNWWKDARKLKDNFRKLEAEADSLGATPTDHGDYVLPDQASDEQKQKFAYLFSLGSLRTYYNTTYGEWVWRARLLQFLEEKDPKMKKPEPSPAST